jgi:phosphatidylinositol 4-kinase
MDSLNTNLISESQFSEKYNRNLKYITESESESENEKETENENDFIISNDLNIKDVSNKNNLSPKFKKLYINEKNVNDYNHISFNYKKKYSDDLTEIEENKNLNSNTQSIQTIFGESIYDQKERLQKSSPFKKFKTFKIFKVLIKTGENLKQEQFATQLISEFKNIFALNKVDIWLSSYEVLSTGENRGLVEIVPNSLSLDEIKQKTGLSLKNFYISYFGDKKSKRYKQAIKNYIRSLAGYSLVCYFLQIKDRHNGNLLIDSQGHIIHIDFGFMLSNSPGKGLNFENAPFKITEEMLELLGGLNSKSFEEYRKRLIQGYFAIYNNYDKILKLNEFMLNGAGKDLPCFEEGEEAIIELKNRLIPKEKMRNTEKMAYIDNLISQSIDNWTTTIYDQFQYYIQGIFY